MRNLISSWHMNEQVVNEILKNEDSPTDSKACYPFVKLLWLYSVVDDNGCHLLLMNFLAFNRHIGLLSSSINVVHVK